MPAYFIFKCSCGRSLRARSDQAGVLIRCWDCGKEQPVPRAKRVSTFIRAYADVVREVFDSETFVPVVLWALAMDLALGVPALLRELVSRTRVRDLVPFWCWIVLALVLAAISMSVGGWRYASALRRTGLGHRAPAGPPGIRGVLRNLAAGAVGLCLGLALAAPLIVRHGVLDSLTRNWHAPLGILPGIAAVSLLAVPFLLALFRAADRVGKLNPLEALRAYLRHPFATALAVLALPVGLAALEAATIGVAWQQMWFAEFVSDLFPPEGAGQAELRYTRMHPVDINNPGDAFFFELYANGLRHGYTLAGTLTASVPRGLYTRLSPNLLVTLPFQYLAVRALFGFLVLTGVASVLAIQARWLGLIPAIDSVRAAPGEVEPVAPPGPPAFPVPVPEQAAATAERAPEHPL